jgi:perosamine synthetase
MKAEAAERAPAGAAPVVRTGPRTRASFLPFSRPWIGEEEVAAVTRCLRSGWLTSGPVVGEFERAFADYVGASHALAVNSCTAALHLALEAVGTGPGSEVITSPMTFAATAAVIEHLGARPVFADCEPGTLNLDPARVAERITPRTRAIVPVHFAGQPCDLAALLPLARAHGIAVVEDAAHALPAATGGRRIGSHGDVTCFSFYATKTLTTGEGGMAVTARPELAERMRLMHLHGMSRDAWKRYRKDGSWRYEILAPGFKYNLPDIAAAIGLQQLRRAPGFHARRCAIADRYHSAFAGVPGLRLPTVRPGDEHAWHLYVVEVDAARAGIDRDALVERLLARNIGVSVHFIPLHVQPFYRDRYGYRPDDFPNALAAADRVVSLPIYPRMTDRDATDVIDAVRGVLAEARR